MSRFLESVSPADPGDSVGRFPVADGEAVDAAVRRARQAFPSWRDAGSEARAKVIRRFRARIEQRRGELASLISREVGKALWETREEAEERIKALSLFDVKTALDEAIAKAPGEW